MKPIAAQSAPEQKLEITKGLEEGLQHQAITTQNFVTPRQHKSLIG
jgi:hypothetical protein